MQTSPLKMSLNPNRFQKGFTFLEILIVIIILGLVLGIVIPTYRMVFKVDIKSSMRRLAGTIKYLSSQAAFKNQTFRLVINIDKNEYWVESSSTKILLQPNAEEQKEEKKEEKFTRSLGLIEEPKKLPKNIKILKILKPATQKSFTADLVYLYFFPHGFVEEIYIYLQDDRENIFTLKTSPYSGDVKLYDKELEVEKK